MEIISSQVVASIYRSKMSKPQSFRSTRSKKYHLGMSNCPRVRPSLGKNKKLRLRKNPRKRRKNPRSRWRRGPKEQSNWRRVLHRQSSRYFRQHLDRCPILTTSSSTGTIIIDFISIDKILIVMLNIIREDCQFK